MPSTPVKLKLLPRSTLKARVTTNITGTIEAGTAITVTKAAGVSTVARAPRSQTTVDQALDRVAHYGSPSTWYDGDWSRSAIAIEQIVSTSPIETGSLTTNAATAAGSAVLHFSSVPTWAGVGANISYRALVATGSNIPASAYVVSTTSTTVTLSAVVTGAGVANGATIVFGANQYLTIPEVTPINVFTFAKSGSLGGTSATGSKQNIEQYGARAENDSGGSGSIWNFIGGGTVTRAWTGYDAANPYNTPQSGLISGAFATEVDGIYLAPAEWAIADQGHATTGNALVLDGTRTYSGSVDHAIPGQYWNGIFLKFGSSTKAIDAGIRWGGPYIYGIDLSGATFTNGAIGLGPDQKILFNATTGTYGATAAGSIFIEYDSGAAALRFSGPSQFVFTAPAAADAAVVINDPSGTHNAILEWQHGGVGVFDLFTNSTGVLIAFNKTISKFQLTLNADGTTTFGTTGSLAGTIKLAGSTSGTVTIQPQAAAGTYNWNLPITAGGSGDILLSAGGGSSPMTWLTPAAGIAAFLATPSSANLATALTDENGSGKVIFSAGTLAITSGKTATISNTVTFTATDGSTLAIGAGGTLASAAYKATGTSGNTVPLLDGANTWSALQTFSATAAANTFSGTSPATTAHAADYSSSSLNMSVADNSSSAAFPSMFAATIFIVNDGTGAIAFYTMTSAVGITMQWEMGGEFIATTTSPGAGKSSFADSGGTVFKIYNHTGSLRNYRAIVTRIR